MTRLERLAASIRSRRERDNLGSAEWDEVASIVESDLAVDRAALAGECEKLRTELEALQARLVVVLRVLP